MIRIIVAVDSKWGIAKNGQQPWDLPSDLAYFRTQTLRYGGQVVMGRKTYDAIGHLFVNRHTIIVTRSAAKIPGATVVNDLDAYLKNLQSDVWIAGGGEVYEQALQYAQEIYITHIAADFACDVFFPALDMSKFIKTSETQPLIENSVQFTQAVYTRS
ncbi:MAG: dihydrofolate reductase, dihydrofolate reductase [Candidatus Saccharibacteria bacterium]|nr:dihydrofolate reductase, dihydrofolate reductase [Candidatus Saccharibacteria bacterium]